ncbi:uncharacterized protein LOC129411739 [Boleophthalmus pectinirostris]|uniref:uncharacterized protein LOC129411739 n=1 Tax=Boleophthalmus pectinirostris TaxID=150288 RepID=UPI002431891E|nr:uncharacterized protein LOC129411739 [Boleophthalmus pectinirostris]
MCCPPPSEPVSNVSITVSSSDLVEFNSSVTLSCSADGINLTTFLWFNGTSEVTLSDRVHLTDGGATLTIATVWRYDHGPFTCKVSDPFSSSTSAPAEVSISYGPDDVILRSSPLLDYYEEGSDVSLSCSADSRPAAHFKWLFNGELLSFTGAQIQVKNMQTIHSGDYSCQAFNSKTLKYTTSQPVRISVLNSAVPPEGLSAGAIAGITVALLVVVVGAAVGGFQMYKHQNSRKFRNNSQNEHHVYENTSNTHNSNNDEETVYENDFNPYNRNLLTRKSSNLKSKRGEVLLCSTELSYVNKSTSSMLRHYGAHGNEELADPPVSASVDEGVVNMIIKDCQPLTMAENEGFRELMKLIATLICCTKQEEPVSNVSITVSSSDLVEFNSSVTLSCSADGINLTTFLWFNGTSEVTLSDRVHLTDGGATLTIATVWRYDHGPFTCKVSDPFSSSTSAPAEVSISYGPDDVILRSSPLLDYYEEGSDVSLSCSADSRPAAHFKWLFNGELLSFTGAQIQVKNMQTIHSGDYSCQAFNSKTLKYTTSQPEDVNNNP